MHVDPGLGHFISGDVEFLAIYTTSVPTMRCHFQRLWAASSKFDRAGDFSLGDHRGVPWLAAGTIPNKVEPNLEIVGGLSLNNRPYSS